MCYYNLYIKYIKYININKYNYKELNLIYNTLSIFYNKYPKDTSIDEFSAFFFIQYPRLKPEEIDAYRLIFDQASKAEVSEEIAETLLRQLAERSKALDIAQHALDVSEGRKDMASLGEAFEGWERPISNGEPIQFITDDLSELKEQTLTKSGLRWRLPSLNRALGSIRLGDFGFVFARPETGKTTFLASEVTYFAGQTDKPIIWFNNEEQGDKVKIRCFQAALGMSLVELFGNVEANQRKYDEVTKRLIKIYDSGSLFRDEVEKVVATVTPSLIVFDQIDKIGGFKADREDLMMGEIYQWARTLAKEVAPVIGICQADGTGEGQKWLSMANVSNAKTAKQAEADWILGIGRSFDEALSSVRHFHLSKNKLTGDIDSDEEWRHAKWDVLIEPQIARYRDLGE